MHMATCHFLIMEVPNEAFPYVFTRAECTFAVLERMIDCLKQISVLYETCHIARRVLETRDHARATLFVLVGIDLIPTEGMDLGLGDSIMAATAPHWRASFMRFCDIAYARIYTPIYDPRDARDTPIYYAAQLQALVRQCLPLDAQSC